MLDSDQYVLAKIAEECAEVAHRALKAQQFGLAEVEPGQALTNMERLLGEFHDLFTTFDELAKCTGHHPLPAQHVTKARLRKMQRVLELSQSLGQVTDELVLFEGDIS